MPGFVSHTVMARDVYNKLKDKNVSIDYMMTYSLGGDLSKYAKCRYDTHHKDMDKFIYEMARYIKDNKLIDDEKVMGVLYGHICHYVMDDTIHPLVRRTCKECIKNKHNHTLVELFYDNYLVHFKKKEYLKKGILNTRSNKVIDKMLNTIYSDIYNTKGVANYYKGNLFLYKTLRNIYIIFGERIIDNIRGLDRFTKKNPNIYDNTLESDYKLSIDLACEYIKNVNNFLKN
jgi:hypothetical protein